MTSATPTAAILAGGLGTRLRASVPDRQKVVAEVAGSPFLEFLFRQMQVYPIAEVVLCTGYRGEQVESLFGSQFGTLKLQYSQEQEPLGTAGALRLALSLLSSDPVLVLNGDSYAECNLQEFIDSFLSFGAEGGVLLTRIEDTTRFGRVECSAEGAISSFLEKGRGGPGTINAGIYLLRQSLLQEIPQGVICSLERELFPRWAAEGRLYGHSAEVSRFIDIGTPETYGAAQGMFGKENV